MKGKLKVYGGNIFVRGVQRRAIVAASSQKEVARIIGCPLYEIREWWCETGNNRELDVALAEPGVVFHADLNFAKREYVRLEK